MKTTKEENLNIEWHTKTMILKAQYGIERVSRYVVKDKFKIVNTF